MNKKTKLIKLIKDGCYNLALKEIMEALDNSPKVMNQEDIVSILKPYSTKPQEYFLVVTLSIDNQVLQVHEITKGILNKSLVHPREVFRAAILDNAAAIIIAHNHPSGNLDPSYADIGITTQLKRAGDIIGIPVLDHIIISRKGSFSLVEHGIMPTSINETNE